MYLSEPWLREWVNPDLNIHQLASQLTMAGLEVESVQDNVIELSLTPNRGDCLSISGIAREVAALNNCKYNPLTIKASRQSSDIYRNILIEESTACPRYVGRIIQNVNVLCSSPLWLTEKLRHSGLRSVNPVVDVTNFVMLELGQPMHAFDNDKLSGDIQIRYAKKGEKLALLDGRDHLLLTEDTLVIADDSGAIALAGIIGGLPTAVTAHSKNIFLESAFFTPQAIVGKARRYNLHTDASHRFERGVDYQIQQQAVVRATQLILDICGGKPGQVVERLAVAQLPQPKEIYLRRNQIERVLGINLTDSKIITIISSLGMRIEAKDHGWRVMPPSFRFDIEIEADLIEEIARVYSYDKIPVQIPRTYMQLNRGNTLHTRIKKMKALLAARGYQEVITYSFVDADLQKMLNPEVSALTLQNPIGPELSVMRTSLLPGLIGAMRYNQKRQQQQLRLFEAGLIFKAEDNIAQLPAIAGVICGNINKNHWGNENRTADLFDLKKDVEVLFRLGGDKIDVDFEAFPHAALHSGQSARLSLNNQYVGFIGALHPAVRQNLEIAQETFVFELEMDAFPKRLPKIYQKISKFPSIKRDLSIIVSEDISVGDIVNSIRNIAPDVLYNIELFDIFRGKHIDLEKKSLGLSLIFQKFCGTLRDTEVDLLIEKILRKLRKEYGALLRE